MYITLDELGTLNISVSKTLCLLSWLNSKPKLREKYSNLTSIGVTPDNGSKINITEHTCKTKLISRLADIISQIFRIFY